MRAASQRLYWALVQETAESLTFAELGSLAAGDGKRLDEPSVLASLRELSSAGLVTSSLDLGGIRDVEVARDDATQGIMRSIFVVHGHDETLLAEVDALLLRVGLRPIVLRAMPSGGRTIIEKIEEYSNVQYAVCLLTPDDEGRAMRTSAAGNMRPRSRQNVVLELGYFLGRLGRDRVHVLHRGGVELPSDYHGVVYTATDVPNSDWRVELCRELRLAGLPVNIAAII